MVSGQGNEEEGANVLNVSIWVEGAVWNMKGAASQKNRGEFWLRIGTTGGRPYADTKENPVLEYV